MAQEDRDTVVRLLIEAMKDKIMRATPETREHETRVVMAFSGIIATLEPGLSCMSLLPSFP